MGRSATLCAFCVLLLFSVGAAALVEGGIQPRLTFYQLEPHSTQTYFFSFAFTESSSGGFYIDYGDGTTFFSTTPDDEGFIHTYAATGTYSVEYCLCQDAANPYVNPAGDGPSECFRQEIYLAPRDSLAWLVTTAVNTGGPVSLGLDVAAGILLQVSRVGGSSDEERARLSEAAFSVGAAPVVTVGASNTILLGKAGGVPLTSTVSMTYSNTFKGWIGTLYTDVSAGVSTLTVTSDTCLTGGCIEEAQITVTSSEYVGVMDMTVSLPGQGASIPGQRLRLALDSGVEISARFGISDTLTYAWIVARNESLPAENDFYGGLLMIVTDFMQIHAGNYALGYNTSASGEPMPSYPVPAQILDLTRSKQFDLLGDHDVASNTSLCVGLTRSQCGSIRIEQFSFLTDTTGVFITNWGVVYMIMDVAEGEFATFDAAVFMYVPLPVDTSPTRRTFYYPGSLEASFPMINADIPIVTLMYSSVGGVTSFYADFDKPTPAVAGSLKGPLTPEFTQLYLPPGLEGFVGNEDAIYAVHSGNTGQLVILADLENSLTNHTYTLLVVHIDRLSAYGGSMQLIETTAWTTAFRFPDGASVQRLSIVRAAGSLVAYGEEVWDGPLVSLAMVRDVSLRLSYGYVWNVVCHNRLGETYSEHSFFAVPEGSGVVEVVPHLHRSSSGPALVGTEAYKYSYGLLALPNTPSKILRMEPDRLVNSTGHFTVAAAANTFSYPRSTFPARSVPISSNSEPVVYGGVSLPECLTVPVGLPRKIKNPNYYFVQFKSVSVNSSVKCAFPPSSSYASFEYAGFYVQLGRLHSDSVDAKGLAVGSANFSVAGVPDEDLTITCTAGIDGYCQTTAVLTLASGFPSYIVGASVLINSGTVLITERTSDTECSGKVFGKISSGSFSTWKAHDSRGVKDILGYTGAEASAVVVNTGADNLVTITLPTAVASSSHVGYFAITGGTAYRIVSAPSATEYTAYAVPSITVPSFYSGFVLSPFDSGVLGKVLPRRNQDETLFPCIFESFSWSGLDGVELPHTSYLDKSESVESVVTIGTAGSSSEPPVNVDIGLTTGSTATHILVASDSHSSSLSQLGLTAGATALGSQRVYLRDEGTRATCSLLAVPSPSSPACPHPYLLREVVLGCSPANTLKFYLPYSTRELLDGNLKVNGVDLMQDLPVNYRPPSDRGRAVPGTPNVYNADPSKLMYRDDSRVTPVAPVFKQCDGASSRAECGCTDSLKTTWLVAHSDCITMVYRAYYGAVFSPPLYIGNEVNQYPIVITEVNGRSDWLVDSAPIGKVNNSEIWNDDQYSTASHETLNVYASNFVVLFSGPELYHFRVHAFAESYCSFDTEFIVWVFEEPVDDIVSSILMAVTIAAFGVALAVAYLLIFMKVGRRFL